MIDLAPTWFFFSGAALLGLVVGSFANVVIYRLPLEQSIVFPASRCPNCGTAIAPWHNVPVFAWIFLKGRCAHCKARISARYPLIEAAFGVGFGLIVARFGLTPFTPFLWAFFFAMVVLALIDWDHQLLPDVITLPWIALGFVGAFIPGSLTDPKESALTAILGYVSFWAVAKSYFGLRGIEGLGEGDWKLSAMMGSFLGGQRLLLTVFLASLTGMVYGLVQGLRHRDSPPPNEGSPGTAEPPPNPASENSDPPPTLDVVVTEAPAAAPVDPGSIGLYKLPFGTFLAASAILVVFWGDRILAWYRLQLLG